MTDVAEVAAALLGSWPQHVSAWGKEGIAAYLAEVAARGVSPDAALVAIRSCGPEHRFPPSAPELASLARRDPNQPTFDELMAQLYGPGGVFGFKRSGVTISPWVLAFVERHGRERLRELPIEDPEEGKWCRKDLERSWDTFVETTEARDLAVIASGVRRGGLGRFDPLDALGLDRPREIEATNGRSTDGL